MRKSSKAMILGIESKLEVVKVGQAIVVEGGLSQECAQDCAEYFSKRGYIAKTCEVLNGAQNLSTKYYALHILK